jgi:hypothetical protein
MSLLCVFRFGDALAEFPRAGAVAVAASFHHFQYSFVTGDFSSEDTPDILFISGCHGVSGHRHGGADGSDLLIFGAVVGSHGLYSSRAGSDGACCFSSYMGDPSFSLFDLTGEL